MRRWVELWQSRKLAGYIIDTSAARLELSENPQVPPSSIGEDKEKYASGDKHPVMRADRELAILIKNSPQYLRGQLRLFVPYESVMVLA